MRTVRLTKALFCGASAGTALWWCADSFQAKWDYWAQVVRNIRSLPYLMRWEELFFPDQAWCQVAGVLLFGIGCSCLAWLYEPSPLFCTFWGFGLLIMSVIGPVFPIIQGIVEWKEGDDLVPWLTHFRDLPWLLGCSLPLVIAGISCRLAKRAVAACGAGRVKMP